MLLTWRARSCWVDLTMPTHLMFAAILGQYI
jgi:hypothetical protein